MSETPAVKQQRMVEEELVRVSRIFHTTFGTPAGKEALEYILTDLCAVRATIGGKGKHVRGDDALYWFGRGDVGREILKLMAYEPRSSAVVVKTKRDGQ